MEIVSFFCVYISRSNFIIHWNFCLFCHFGSYCRRERIHTKKGSNMKTDRDEGDDLAALEVLDEVVRKKPKKKESWTERASSRFTIAIVSLSPWRMRSRLHLQKLSVPSLTFGVNNVNIPSVALDTRAIHHDGECCGRWFFGPADIAAILHRCGTPWRCHRRYCCGIEDNVLQSPHLVKTHDVITSRWIIVVLFEIFFFFFNESVGIFLHSFAA